MSASLGSTIARLCVAWLQSRQDIGPRLSSYRDEKERRRDRTFRIDPGRQTGKTFAAVQILRQVPESRLVVFNGEEVNRLVREVHVERERLCGERRLEKLEGTMSGTGVVIADNFSCFKSGEDDLWKIVPHGFLILLG